jgi:hypothetical protein
VYFVRAVSSAIAGPPVLPRVWPESSTGPKTLVEGLRILSGGRRTETVPHTPWSTQ